MWTAEVRKRYARDNDRCPSDLPDDAWAIIEPLLPIVGRSDRQRPMLDAILHVLETGCQWRALPTDFLPKSSVRDYFVVLHCDGILTRVHDELYEGVRELAGKAAGPTPSIVDSQSVKSAEKGGPRATRPGTTQARKSKARSAPSPMAATRVWRPPMPSWSRPPFRSRS